jgi:hypothetical protein
MTSQTKGLILTTAISLMLAIGAVVAIDELDATVTPAPVIEAVPPDRPKPTDSTLYYLREINRKLDQRSDPKTGY